MNPSKSLIGKDTCFFDLSSPEHGNFYLRFQGKCCAFRLSERAAITVVPETSEKRLDVRACSKAGF